MTTLNAPNASSPWVTADGRLTPWAVRVMTTLYERTGGATGNGGDEIFAPAGALEESALVEMVTQPGELVSGALEIVQPADFSAPYPDVMQPLVLPLDATGVTPGTYGSATQVPQITVNDAGQITNVSDVTIGGAATSFTAIATGMTSSPTGNVIYAVIGNVVVLNFPSIGGTSNATTFTLTGMPAACRPASTRSVVVRVQDNGSAYLTGLAQIDSTGVVTLAKDLSGSAFTASGTKSIGDMSVSYPVQ